MNLNDPNQRAIYNAGVQAAQQQMGQQYDLGLKQAVASLRDQSSREINKLAGGLRRQVTSELEKADRRLSDMAALSESLRVMRDGGGGDDDEPGVIRIENIPGRRVPFTLLVDIPIGPDETSVRQQSVTISQSGPFVAVKRMATFISSFEFQATNEVTGAVARLAGRSFGRHRPIHSAMDYGDGRHASSSDSVAWFLAASTGPPAAGTVLPTATLSQPSNMSSFRTMEFDGRITIINEGSGFPRQNISVPTSMWTPFVNAPFDLAALDFFERGEVLTIQVQPTHVNNPAAGNVDGECIFPAAAAGGFLGYPFVAGQYDSHEGICTPNGVLMGDGGTEIDWEPTGTDTIARLPSGILTIGWEGYRIQQPVAPIG
jgi:hypothetical protein